MAAIPPASPTRAHRQVVASVYRYRHTVIARSRDDLRPGIQMATIGRHCIFFEADDSRVLVVRVLHDRMDYRGHLGAAEAPNDEA